MFVVLPRESQLAKVNKTVIKTSKRSVERQPFPPPTTHERCIKIKLDKLVRRNNEKNNHNLNCSKIGV